MKWYKLLVMGTAVCVACYFGGIDNASAKNNKGNQGNGYGNTGPGNRGNDKDVGNAGGNRNTPDTPDTPDGPDSPNGNNPRSGGHNTNNDCGFDKRDSIACQPDSVTTYDGFSRLRLVN